MRGKLVCGLIAGLVLVSQLCARVPRFLRQLIRLWCWMQLGPSSGNNWEPFI